MSELPACPKCASEYVYEMGALLVCPECAHEFEVDGAAPNTVPVIRDSVGKELQDGDSVVVVKDLKVKGYPNAIKVGTKVRGIRLVHGNGDHDIDCKVDGFGQMMLKSSVVKKA